MLFDQKKLAEVGNLQDLIDRVISVGKHHAILHL
jgi:hypothetical protein